MHATASGGIGDTWIDRDPGEPNDDGGEDCARMLEDGTWNDIPCDHEEDAVCDLYYQGVTTFAAGSVVPVTVPEVSKTM